MAIFAADVEARLRPFLAEQSVLSCRHYLSWIGVFARLGIDSADRLDGDARDLLDLVILQARPKALRRLRHNRRMEHDLRDTVTVRFPMFFAKLRPYKGS